MKEIKKNILEYISVGDESNKSGESRSQTSAIYINMILVEIPSIFNKKEQKIHQFYYIFYFHSLWCNLKFF